MKADVVALGYFSHPRPNVLASVFKRFLIYCQDVDALIAKYQARSIQMIPVANGIELKDQESRKTKRAGANGHPTTSRESYWGIEAR